MKHQISNIEALLQSADKKIDENKENLDSQLHDFIKKNNLSRLISLQCLKKLNQVIPVIDEKKKETSRKLHLLMNEMNSVQRQVTDLENHCLFPVGFTAYIKDAITPKMHTLLNGFDNIKYNLSGSFDPSTGIFTAPTDGMYVVSLTIGQAGEGAIGARIDQVLKYPGVLSGDEKPIMIGEVWTTVDNTSSCMVCVVHMRTGDTVCITTVHVSGAAKCNALSCFSCFLV
ncbi:uncharacterized protein LOC131947214 [Physella acuta]|uniref:uncharacterized protein LOC131947214 n=1 Tax=Physella acuta TaxID=109671 RepID=UPI0027DAF1D4|nr:uncharacterized protein LOC131947214 [Physella acuta]